MDKYNKYIELIRDLISRFTPQKLNYRKPLLEMPNIPETRATLSIMTYEEFGFLSMEIITKRIDVRKPIEERFFFYLTPEEVGLKKSAFYSKMNRLRKLGVIDKAKGVGMYVLNPAFIHNGLTMYEKYQLGFMSEKEYIAKMKFSERVKQMSSK